MKKRILSALLILTLLCCSIPVVSIPVSASDSVTIATVDDFLSIRDASDRDYIITVSELDFSGVTDFTPFDTFTGSLNCSAPGGQCVIKNLTIDCANARTGAGLFNYLCGSVDGLIMDSSCSLVNTNAKQHIGMIAGYAGVGGSISNCTNYADICGNTAYPVAGILGTAFAKNGKNVLTNCSNYGTICNENAFAAGIVGMSNAENNTVDMQNCSNYGDITSGLSNASGIFAQVGKNGVVLNCTECVNTGNVKAGVYGGGIFGSSAKCTYTFAISKCVNYGNVSAENSAAGIFANSNTTGVEGSITLCINYGTVYQSVKESQAGGIAGYIKPVATTGTVTLENNINYGRVSVMKTNPTSQSAGILTRAHCNTAFVNVLGNVNYGLVLPVEGQTGNCTGIVSMFNGTMTNSKAENNFAANITDIVISDITPANGCGDLIDNDTLTALNTLYPDVFAMDESTGMITLSWAMEKGHSASGAAVVKPQYAGYQTSALTNGTYSVRFVSAINSLSAKEVGYTIVASYADNSKTFQRKTTTVYQTLLATNPSGTMTEYSAPELGGAYLFALTITDIPAGVGTVTFTVKPYCVTLSGDTVLGEDVTFTLDPAALN